MATLSSNNNTTSIQVTSNNVAYYYEAIKTYKNDAAEYAELAKDWANKTDGSVDGSEFSAKYYAELAASQVQTGLNNIASYISEIESSVEAAENAQASAESSAEAAAASTAEAAASAEAAAASEANAAASETNAENYADLAKDWAIKTDDTVDGEEYSAKYYAEYTQSMLEDLVTEDELTAALSNVSVDLTSYYTSTETDAAIAAAIEEAIGNVESGSY